VSQQVTQFPGSNATARCVFDLDRNALARPDSLSLSHSRCTLRSFDRQSILRPLNSKSCSTSIPAYNPSAISDAVRKHWQCTNPSYTSSNADGWYERVWDMGLGCAAQKLGMTQTEAFEYMTSLWDRYKPDAALRKSRTCGS